MTKDTETKENGIGIIYEIEEAKFLSPSWKQDWRSKEIKM
jgi:hypothetical protein